MDALGAGRGQGLGDGVGDAQGHVAVARAQVLGHEAPLEDELEGLVDVVLDAELGTVRRGARGADGMHAADCAADATAVLGVELVERAATHLGERGVVDAVRLVQRLTGAEVHRRDRRHLGGDQVLQEAMLVQDRLARPAARAIELHDQAALVLQLHLVHAVLEGAQRQAAAGAAQAAHLNGIEHPVGGEGVEGRAGLGGHADRVSYTWC